MGHPERPECLLPTPQQKLTSSFLSANSVRTDPNTLYEASRAARMPLTSTTAKIHLELCILSHRPDGSKHSLRAPYERFVCVSSGIGIFWHWYRLALVSFGIGIFWHWHLLAVVSFGHWYHLGKWEDKKRGGRRGMSMLPFQNKKPIAQEMRQNKEDLLERLGNLAGRAWKQ